jgi:hypothetical protein
MSGPARSGWMIRFAIAGTIAVVVLGFAAFLGWEYLAHEESTPAPSPSAAELARIEAAFPARRGELEAIVSAEQFGNRVRRMRDTLLAAGDTARTRALDREYEARLAAIGSVSGHWQEGQVFDFSDSVILISAWARRGKGPSAPWHYAGYAYRPLSAASRSAPPIGSDSLAAITGRRDGMRHLDGHWWLFSMAGPRTE